MRRPSLFVRQRCHGRPTARAHRRVRHRAAEPERPDRVRPKTPRAQIVELLSSIPGAQAPAAQVLIAECGVDMSLFPTAGHFASWAGVCPGRHQSAGRRRSVAPLDPLGGQTDAVGPAASELDAHGQLEPAQIASRVRAGSAPSPGAPDLVPVRIADLPHVRIAPRRLLGRDRWRPPDADLDRV